MGEGVKESGRIPRTVDCELAQDLGKQAVILQQNQLLCFKNSFGLKFCWYPFTHELASPTNYTVFIHCTFKQITKYPYKPIKKIHAIKIWLIKFK